MKKTTLLDNLKFIAFGLVVAAGLSLVHADFPAPTTTPPGANIDVPLHTGPSQVKDGGLSVGSFIANDNAQFKQQTFLNGTVFGGSPANAQTSSTVAIGDVNRASISVNGDLSAIGGIKNDSVANANSSALCADTGGTIILCGSKNVITPLPPTTKHFLSVTSRTISTTPPSISGAQTFHNTAKYYSANQIGCISSQEIDGFCAPEYWAAFLNSNPDNCPPTRQFPYCQPFVGIIGIDNDKPSGWQVNTLPGIQATAFDSDHTQLLKAVDSATYHVKISSNGRFVVNGYTGFEADFYLKVHHAATNTDEWIRLDTMPLVDPLAAPWASPNHEDYPIAGRFVGSYSNANSNNVLFNFSFDQNIALQAGDTLDPVALIYASAGGTDPLWTGFYGRAGTANYSVSYSMQTNVGGTTFDITEVQ